MSTLNRFAGTRNGIEVMASKLDILELGGGIHKLDGWGPNYDEHLRGENMEELLLKLTSILVLILSGPQILAFMQEKGITHLMKRSLHS
jgi:hypothetical protein